MAKQEHKAQQRPSPLLLILTLLILIPVALIIITTPLTLEHQCIFGLITAGLLIASSRIKRPWARQAMILLTLLISSRYLYYRFTNTVMFDSLPEWILGCGLLAAEFYAWLVMVLGFIQTIWPLNRTIVPLPEDTELWPTVDIYIPTYNESLDIVRDTVLAAQNIDYPREKVAIYILDDGRRPEFGAFASAAGVGYITRNDNKHAKAGNLNNAMTKTHGELICIFDCDHVATRTFLQATIGGFLVDPKLALLQTPHYFYSPDPFERNLLGHRQLPKEGALFYGPVQRGNDFWNAAFFCGSCAVIRRSALAEIEGFATDTVTEDAHTALKLQRKGWNTAFLDIKLSAGLATERLSLMIGQRARWARGMIQILRLDNPLFGRGLTLGQRLCYFNAILHFLFPAPRLMFLLAPLVYLLFNLNIIAASPAMIMAYAVPHLFNAIYTNSRLLGQYRHSFWGEVYETVLAFHIVIPTIVTFFNPRKGKFNVTEKGGLLEKDYFDAHAVRPHLFTLFLLIAGVILGLVRIAAADYFHVQPSVVWLNILWATLSILVLTVSVLAAKERRQLRESVRVDVELPAVIYLSTGHTLQTTTRDLSMTGGRLISPDNWPADAEIEDIELIVNGEAEVFSANLVEKEKENLRFQFLKQSIRQRRALVNVVMGRADSWLPNTPPANDKPLSSLKTILEIIYENLFSRQKAAAHAPDEPKSHPWRWVLLVITIIVISVMVMTQQAQAAEQPISPEFTAPAAINEQETQSREISFQDMGHEQPLTVYSNGSTSAVHFSLRRDVVVTQSSLTLDLNYTPPEGQSLVLQTWLNGQPLADQQLDNFNSEGLTTTIDIDPALILPYNSLEFRLTDGGNINACLIDEDDAKWAQVSIQSHVSFTEERLSSNVDLSHFPRPFFDKGEMGITNITMVFPAAPDNTMLEAGDIMASIFGQESSFQPVKFVTELGQLPERNAIVFATPGTQIAGLELPTVKGPALMMTSNPLNPNYQLLLVMGDNARQLKTAVSYLQLHGRPIKGQYLDVPMVSAPSYPAYSAPNWQSIQQPIQLGQLATPEQLSSYGLHHGTIDLSFRLPPDLMFWSVRNIPLRLFYVFPEDDWLDEDRSSLSVRINGKYLTSLPVNRSGIVADIQHLFGGDVRQDSAVIEIPKSLLYAENNLQFYFDIKGQNNTACTLPANSIVSRILPKSSFNLTKGRHFTKLPNLGYFTSVGFPFSRYPDLNGTLLALPNTPTAQEISAMFNLMAKMGHSTGIPSYQVQVRQSLDINESDARNKDLLVVATTDDIQGHNLLSDSPFVVAGQHVSLRNQDNMSAVFAWLKGDWGREIRQARRMLNSERYFTGVLGHRSPFSKHRNLVIVTAHDDEALTTLTSKLSDPRHAVTATGDLLLFDQQWSAHSYRVGDQYSQGQVPLHIRVRWFFAQHVILMMFILLFAALLGARVLYSVLAHRAEQRIKRPMDNDDEE